MGAIAPLDFEKGLIAPIEFCLNKGNLHQSIKIRNALLGILHPSIEITNDAPGNDCLK